MVTNRGNLDKLHHKKTQNWSYCDILCFVLKRMHGPAPVDFRFCLLPKYHGYSLSALTYEFYLHPAQLNNLDSK